MSKSAKEESSSKSAEESLYSPHDVLFKGVFKNPKKARPVLRTTLPRQLRRMLDFRTLRREDGSFVKKELLKCYSDLLFSVRTKATVAAGGCCSICSMNTRANRRR